MPLLGWSLLIVIVGGIGAVSHWVLDTSVFHQMASAPAVSPHWEANGVMVAIGCAGAARWWSGVQATGPPGRVTPEPKDHGARRSTPTTEPWPSRTSRPVPVSAKRR